MLLHNTRIQPEWLVELAHGKLRSHVKTRCFQSLIQKPSNVPLLLSGRDFFQITSWRCFFFGNDGTFFFSSHLGFSKSRSVWFFSRTSSFQSLTRSTLGYLAKISTWQSTKNACCFSSFFNILRLLNHPGFVYQHPLPFLAFFGGSSTETRHKASLLQADPSWRSIDGPVGQNGAVCSKKWEMPWANWPPKSWHHEKQWGN